MKKFIIPIVFLLLTLCSCSSNSDNNIDTNNSTVQTKEFFAMDTFMSVKAYGVTSDSVLDDAESEVLRLEKLFSVTDSESDIYKINSHSGTAVEVSDDTSKIIKKANDISTITNGAVDISIYPVLKEWGFTTGEYKVPDDNTIDNLLGNVDYTKIQITGNTVTIPKEYKIDLGSIAKGYTGDRIIELLKKNGINSAIVNLGGNVQTLNSKPDGSKWNVAIKNPINQENEICVVKVSNKAVVTSGNYERYFSIDNKKYWHILDTSTGKPADNGLISVTVIGDSGTICDSLSTALFVMGTDKAISYAKENTDIDVILVTNEMEIFITENIADNVEMLNNHSYSLITGN